MTLNTYLFFDGRCAEAFEFYRGVFGGEFAMRMTFAEAPPGVDFPAERRDWIMHVSLPVGGSVLMGSDSAQARPAAGFAISVSAASREEADARFAALSDGGKASMPMQDVFWGSYFGMATDRFGVEWMVSHDPQPPGRPRPRAGCRGVSFPGDTTPAPARLTSRSGN